MIRKILSRFKFIFLKNLNLFKLHLIRLLELIGQLFPGDAQGCRIRGLFYRPFLKKCGKNFQVSIGARLEHLQNIEIGNDVYIGPGCWICGIRGGIIFEDQVMLGPHICMVSSNHTSIKNSFRFGPGIGGQIHIGKGTWIAANCVITAGVTIGEGCLIAAGAVVTKDCEPFIIAGGVPAQKIKNLKREK